MQNSPIQKMLLSAGLLFGSLSACVSPLDQTYSQWPNVVEADWRVTDSESPPRNDSRQRGGSASVEAPPGDVEAWVTLALERNAGLRAAGLRVERLRQVRPQVTSLEDPMLTIAPLGEMAQTAAGEVGWMAGLSQRFPFPGKLDARGDAADATVEQAIHNLEAMRLQVAADTRRAWWSLIYVERAIEVVERDRGLVSQFLDVAEAKYRAGTVEQQDVLRAQVELTTLDNQIIQLNQHQVTAIAALNQLADRRIDGPVEVSAHITPNTTTALRSLDDLLDLATRHPRLAALRSQHDRFRAERRQAQLDRYPDVNVSLNYNAVDRDGLSPVADGEDQFWLGLGINLPLWQGRRDAAERAAMLGTLETSAMLAEEQNRLAYRVRDALARADAQARSVELFEQRMLPEARQAVDAASGSYRAGRTDFLTLIDNTRRLTELDLMYQQALTRLQQDLADLELAVGQSLSDSTGHQNHE